MPHHNPSTLIEQPNSTRRFLVMDAPTPETLPLSLDHAVSVTAKAWVRCCESASYADDIVQQRGLSPHDFAFPDGDAPPADLIKRWLELCDEVDGTIAVHCVAGLGRAPLLVALALIESGTDSIDAIHLIRTRRRGAINKLQLKSLQEYTPMRRRSSNKCPVM